MPFILHSQRVSPFRRPLYPLSERQTPQAEQIYPVVDKERGIGAGNFVRDTRVRVREDRRLSEKRADDIPRHIAICEASTSTTAKYKINIA